MKKKIVHVCELYQFIPPFIDFLASNFEDFTTRHHFYIVGDRKEHNYKLRPNICHVGGGEGKRLSYVLALARDLHRADKIILHGLFNQVHLIIIACMPWIHKKCYWAIWGGDLYVKQSSQRTARWRFNEVLRRWLIPRLGHFITHVRGDYELARQWYCATGHWNECFMYPSNIFRASKSAPTTHEGLNVLVGNSADPSNNHIEALKTLCAYRDRDIHIYVPLSYGDPKHAQKVKRFGKENFGDKFTALMDFMPLKDYLTFLECIDIAIFNHDRQQAMGNMITLLGQRKRVAMRRNVTSYAALKELGITLEDIDNLNLAKGNAERLSDNQNIIASYFSERNLKKSWGEIFD